MVPADDGLACGLERLRQIAELADDSGLLVKAVVEVLENENRIRVGIGLSDGLQRSEGVFCVRGWRCAGRFGHNLETIRNIPSEQAALSAFAKLFERGDDTLLFVGRDPHDGEARTEANLDFFGEFHGAG